MAKRKSASSTEEVKDWSWDQAKGYFLLYCGHFRRNVYEFLFETFLKFHRKEKKPENTE